MKNLDREITARMKKPVSYDQQEKEMFGRTERRRKPVKLNGQDLNPEGEGEAAK